jgi:hypothetical protein
MARTILLSSSALNNITTAGRFLPLAMGRGLAGGYTAQGNCETLYRTAGTLSLLSIRISGNNRNAASTFTVRINNGSSSSDGNLVVSVPSSTTGLFQDTTNTDAITAGWFISLRVDPGGTGATFQVTPNWVHFEAAADTVMVTHSVAADAGFTFTNNNLSQFPGLSGFLQFQGTEANSQVEVNSSVTVKNQAINVTANTRGQDSFAKFRINGADVLTATIPFGVTGWFEDNSSASIVADDLINFRYQTQAGGGSLTFRVQSANLVTTDDTFYWVTSANISPSLGADRFVVCGGEISTYSVELQAQMLSDLAGSAANLYFRLSANTSSVETQFLLRKNGVDTALVVTIPASTSGTFENTGSVSFDATDLLCYRWVLPAGTGSPSMQGSSMKLVIAAAAVPFMSSWFMRTAQPYVPEAEVVPY